MEIHKEIGVDHGILLPIFTPESITRVQTVVVMLDIVKVSNGNFISPT